MNAPQIALRPRQLRQALLPPSLPPRGLHREEAAAYVGVSATLFDEMVKGGYMPRPKRFGGRNIWDRHQIDQAFSALPSTDSAQTGWNAVK